MIEQEEENCMVCDRPICIYVDTVPQCNECYAYEGGGMYEYDIDYSDKSKLDKYQLKMLKVFGQRKD
jgi:hypothetical protein